MPTFIYSKRDFIKFVEKEVDDEKVIVFTQELFGNLSVSKKSGLRITHQFAETAFKDTGVGHIAFGKSIPLAMIITDKERISDGGLKVLNKDLQAQVSDTTMSQ